MNTLGKAIWQETPQAIARMIPLGENFYRVVEGFYKNLRETQSPSQDAPALQGLVSQTPEAIDAAAADDRRRRWTDAICASDVGPGCGDWMTGASAWAFACSEFPSGMRESQASGQRSRTRCRGVLAFRWL
jgi:hypothetical protein